MLINNHSLFLSFLNNQIIWILNKAISNCCFHFILQTIRFVICIFLTGSQIGRQSCPKRHPQSDSGLGCNQVIHFSSIYKTTTLNLNSGCLKRPKMSSMDRKWCFKVSNYYPNSKQINNNVFNHIQLSIKLYSFIFFKKVTM
jgi:hypothetical protein